MNSLDEYINSLDANRHDYTIMDLVKAFKAAGYSHARSWIYRQEEKGNLVFMKSPTEYKKAQGDRKIGFVRQMTSQQMKDIVIAFMPGGSGYYDYRK